MIKKISDTEIVDGARDYRLMTRQFVNSLLELEEYNRFSKGLYGWVGYKTKWMEYETSRELQVRQSGLSGNCLCMQSKGLLLFLQYRC